MLEKQQFEVCSVLGYLVPIIGSQSAQKWEAEKTIWRKAGSKENMKNTGVWEQQLSQGIFLGFKIILFLHQPMPNFAEESVSRYPRQRCSDVPEDISTEVLFNFHSESVIGPCV